MSLILTRSLYEALKRTNLFEHRHILLIVVVLDQQLDFFPLFLIHNSLLSVLKQKEVFFGLKSWAADLIGLTAARMTTISWANALSLFIFSLITMLNKTEIHKKKKD